MTVGTLATYPPRYECARKVIRRVSSQLDRLHVYINDQNGAGPEWSSLPANVHLTRGRFAKGDLSDVGKFYFDPELSTEDVHFTLDDDIAYPEDYVERTLHHLNAFDGAAMVGYHACKLPDVEIASYFDQGQMSKRSFMQHVDGYTPVHLLGTGTMAYAADRIRFPLSAFLCQDMADLWVAVRANDEGVPMLCCPREKHWLRPYRTNGEALFDQYKDNDAAQTWIVNSHEWTLRTPTCAA